ncbi:hypothetical protein J4H89_23560 (plasmid) [Ralstonia solanacearum]|nr:hypothetical protein J4H89_23560 [Ralstonia solanacearum]
MSWYFFAPSRSALIQELIKPWSTSRGACQVIAHTLRGNVLWSVVEVTAKGDGERNSLPAGQLPRYIRCDLLECSSGTWGFKPLQEAMHPYYYSCPLSYLDMAPEQSHEWRKGVRAYHARRRSPTASSSA